MNKFKYVKDKFAVIKEKELFKDFMDFLITSLAFGISIFLLKKDNSFARGIGFAIIIALVQGYIKWLAELVKEMMIIKRNK